MSMLDKLFGCALALPDFPITVKWLCGEEFGGLGNRDLC